MNPTVDVSRRQTLTMLMAGLSALGLGLGGCTGDKPKGAGSPGDDGGGSGGTDSDSEPSGGGGPPDPVLDAARLDDALNAFLSQTQWADRYPNLAADAQKGVEALRENGHNASANAATYMLNGIGANLASVLAVALADTDGTAVDKAAVTQELVSEMKASAAGIRGELDASIRELTDALGSDTVPAMPELGAEMATLEADIRKEMHALGMNGNAILNSMLSQFQGSRADVSTESSAAQTSARVDNFLAGLASDEDVDAWAEGLRSRLPRTLRELDAMGLRSSPPPPPDATTDAICDVVAWIDWIVNLSKSIHDAGTALAGRVASYVDELGEDFAYFNASYARWEAAEYSTVAADQLKGKMNSAVNGTMETLAEEECDALAAIFVIVFWFTGLIAGIIAYGEIMGAVLGAAGATPGGLAIALIMILLMLFLLQFTLWIICGLLSVMPALETLGGQCTPTTP